MTEPGGWATRPVPDRRSVSGRYCRLDPVDVTRHGPALFAAFAAVPDDSDWYYLPYGPFSAAADFADWLRGAVAGADPLFYAITPLAEDRVAGLASLMRVDPVHGVIETGHIHFSRLLQRTPAATEAIVLLMRHVFDDLGYRRLEWKCDAANTRSCRAAVRLGFTYEGTFRQHRVVKGRNRDTAWFSILDHEWPARRAAFDAWLDPANFDADGQQRDRLAHGRGHL